LVDHDQLRAIDLLLGQRRTAPARAALEPLLLEAPDHPEIHLRLARAAAIDDDNDEAREHLASVFAQAPDHEGALYLLAALDLDDRRFREAEANVIRLLERAPRDADYLALYARIMLLTMHLKKARLLAEEAVRVDPTGQNGLLVMGLIGVVEGRSDLTEETLNRLISDDPDGERVLRLLFYALASGGRHAEALRVAQRLLRLVPHDNTLVDAVVEMRVATHWSTWPLYPMFRFGWAGAAVLWGLFIVLAPMARRVNPTFGTIFVTSYLLWVVYSWAYPPWLRRRLRARGI